MVCSYYHRCFEQAMSLNPKHCYILEKVYDLFNSVSQIHMLLHFSILQFGFFCYNVQAFTSQIISHVSIAIACGNH